MIEPHTYDLEFISIRIICPKTQAIILEAMRAVTYIQSEPDWRHLDDVVSTFLDEHHIEEYNKLSTPQIHPAGGWMTHSFDMGCPRQIWIFPHPALKGGVLKTPDPALHT